MDEEDGADAGRIHGLQRGKAHDDFLHLVDVHLGDVAHADAGTGDGDEKEQREIVGRQRDVAELFRAHAAQQQEGQGAENEGVGQVEAGSAHLEHAVHEFDDGNAHGHRVKEEACVADDDHEHAVMEQQGEHPQPLVGKIGDARRAVDGGAFRSRVAEQGPEGEHLKDHAADDGGRGPRAFETVGLDPVQRTLLARHCGNGERYGRFSPANDLPDEADDEHSTRYQRQDHAEQILQAKC